MPKCMLASHNPSGSMSFGTECLESVQVTVKTEDLQVIGPPTG